MNDRKAIKYEAKQMIRDHRGAPILAAALFLLVSFVLNRIVILLEYGTLIPEIQIIRHLMNGDLDAALAAEQVATTGFFSMLVSLFMTVLQGGFYIYCMGTRQGLDMPYSTLLDGLGVAGKLIWCSILISIRVSLLSLLFVVPGIVAAYRYRFAFFNILTDNSLSASEAIRLSNQQTQGIKWQLFVLDLSFFGWALVSELTLGLLQVWLMPYMALCDLAYFEESQRRLGRSPYGGPVPPQEGDPWNTL